MLERLTTIAFLVEIITNGCKRMLPTLPKRNLPLLAGLIGIILAISTKTGILTLMEIPIGYGIIDHILTGIIISRGANIVHDVAKKLNV